MTTMAQMKERYNAIKSALPATQREVAAKIGLSNQRVSEAIKVMRERKMLHISKWKPGPVKYSKPICVYSVGNFPDEPHPPLMEGVRRMKFSRAGISKNG